MTTELEMAKSGEFLREYGTQYFVVVVEALNIGRVKWSMVPIGKSGQNDIVFYMTTEKMLNLCHEILNGEFKKKVDADTGAYPSAYKYVTGEDGYLHLNIGGGKKGCRIQLQDTKTKANYQMAVSVETMLNMARKYMVDTGMMPVSPNSYYASVVAVFEEGRVERAQFRKNTPDGLTDVVDSNNIIDEDVENSAKVESAKVEKPVENKAPVKPENAESEEPKVENFKLTINGARAMRKGFYVFSGKDEGGNAISLMFRKEDAETLNWFKKFEDKAAAEGTTLVISGEKRNEFILYKGPAKK